LAMAAGATRTGTARLGWAHPGAPTVADLTLATTAGTPVGGTLGISPAAVDEVEVVTPPASGTLVLDASAVVGHGPSTGFVGRVLWRVRRRLGDLWSAPAVVPVAVPDEAGLRGRWRFDQATGTTALGDSGWGHHATLSGGASRTTGPDGGALLLDGIS